MPQDTSHTLCECCTKSLTIRVVTPAHAPSPPPPSFPAGLVDLIHTLWLPLPPGVPHFFLGAAFGSSGFLMLAHTKGQPLDGLLHQLLGGCMVAVALLALAQASGTAAGRRGRRSYGLEAARSLAVIMEVGAGGCEPVGLAFNTGREQ